MRGCGDCTYEEDEDTNQKAKGKNEIGGRTARGGTGGVAAIQMVPSAPTPSGAAGPPQLLLPFALCLLPFALLLTYLSKTIPSDGNIGNIFVRLRFAC